MAQSEEKIIKDFKEYVKEAGGNYACWYVGTSANPADGLFNRHRVDKYKDCWILAFAADHEIARKIKSYFMQSLGTDGRPGDDGTGARGVYAYRKASHTVPTYAYQGGTFISHAPAAENHRGN